MHRKCTENAREPGGSKPRSRPSGIPAAKRPALSTLTYPLDLRRGSTRRNVKGRVKVRVDRPGLFRPPNRPEIASPAAGLASRSRAAQSRPEPPGGSKSAGTAQWVGQIPSQWPSQWPSQQPSQRPSGPSSDGPLGCFRSLSTRRLTVLNYPPGVMSIDASRVRSSARRVD